MDQSNIFGQKIIEGIGLTFDDVLLLPNFCEVKRQEIDVSTNLTAKIRLKIPLLSSPMDTVTEENMSIGLNSLGGLGVIHRNLTIDIQAKKVAAVKKESDLCAAAVGVGPDLEERAEKLISSGCDVLIIDSAHGHSKWVIEATGFLSSRYTDTEIISGSIATAAGAKALIEAGADCLRVGMGPGSICSTRIVAGMGVPQITAILETVSVAHKHSVPVISDGGLRSSGDLVKAVACGASTVMTGSLLAGCRESPGKLVTVHGGKYKFYRGMGSVSAMKEGSAARYGQMYRKGQRNKLIAEGVEGLVPFKGNLDGVVEQLIGGLRTGMYYAGVKNIEELQTKTRLMRISHSSLLENHPHDIIIKEIE